MQDIRQGYDHLTIWLRPDLKKEMDVHFITDEDFKRRHLTNITNRASLRSSKYTGKLATFMKTKSRLIYSLLIFSKLLEREETLAKTFKYTRTLKVNKEKFVDEWSMTHYMNLN
ncbi:hypothetical protein Ahy_A04g020466 [Arachis hypogaea]|uniref:Uncharacterized protein n=1 Tax=Arachis hypogaea TaxID=3818 RepID=A0A445DHR8_ARAHY|nr:hypothetical protein Ahy_A04g020466 [Arachis hypogaea]